MAKAKYIKIWVEDDLHRLTKVKVAQDETTISEVVRSALQQYVGATPKPNPKERGKQRQSA